MSETPYPIDKLPEPYRKPIPRDLTDIPEQTADRPDSLYTGEDPAPAAPYSMPRLYRHTCTGMPWDMPETLGLLPGDMPMLYDLWGVWS